MLTLRSSPPSPFGRKVKIAAKILGLDDRIAIVPADTTDPHDTLRQQNPLGKVPTLVLEDGTCLFDSRVIVEYLDELAGGGRVIPKGAERFAALRLAALADGIAEAALLLVYERRVRPEGQWNQTWIDSQQGKIDRALLHLESDPPGLTAPPTIGEIGIACGLGYLDLRFAGRWRSTHPRLAAWLDRFAAAVPAYAQTAATP